MVDLDFSFLPRLPFQNLQELILNGKFNMSDINVKKQTKINLTLSAYYSGYTVYLYLRERI